MLAGSVTLTRRGARAFRTVDRRRKRSFRLFSWFITLAAGLCALALCYALLPASHGILVGMLVLCGLLIWADGWMRQEGGVAILTYHSVSADPRWLPWADQISVTPELFSLHLGALKRWGMNVMRTGELVEARRRGRKLPARPVIIHLDDGYLDNWVAAVPLLRRHGMPATLFVSTDFVEPGGRLRPTLEEVEGTSLRWEGYANWGELKAIRDGGLIEIEPHGVDHGRVEVAPEIVDRVSADNWRRLAWVQWASMTGPKHDWFRPAEPPAVALGTPVRRSDSAFAARAWSPTHMESDAEFEQRVRRALRQCRDVLARELSIAPAIFCWPQNRHCPRAVEIAYEEGFDAVTGGSGENGSGEDPRMLSRVHVGGQAGGRPWLETIAFLATIRTFQGNYYWYLPLLVMRLLRPMLRKSGNASRGAGA
jgi:peptidoglycan/xylan/chitin deacetylase (PgdA/CDA1 family)